MANRFIGGVLSSRPQANTPFSSRASTGTYFDSAGVLRTAPINQPRLNYNLVGSAWTQPSVLIEPASTNILLYSQDFDNAAWPKIATVTANTTTAPDGTTTADSMAATASVSYIYTTDISSNIAGRTCTFSCYVKAGTNNFVALNFQGSVNSWVTAIYNLSTGLVTQTANGSSGLATLTSTSITSVGNGWYRCVITASCTSAVLQYLSIMFAPSATGNTITSAYGEPSGNTIGNTLIIWGAQAEVNSLGATSYIPTTSAAVTRAADVVGPGTSGIYGLYDRQNSTSNDDQSTVTSFTSTGSTSWTAPADVTSVEVLVVAGGGAGGSSHGGGGGGGEVLYNPSFPVTPGVTYPITVGIGGAKQTWGSANSFADGGPGRNSNFGTLTAKGGQGGKYNGPGGASGNGYPGGDHLGLGNNAAGGGGGAGGFATPATATLSGGGGPGLQSNITGTASYYGGGGGATGYPNQYAGPGGVGGGGAGQGVNGSANTGGGGAPFADGGSGIVVVKYKRSPRQLASTSNAAIVTQKFTVSNTWTAPAGVTSVEALVVGGGGGGGGQHGGGGGGAGGLVYNSAFAVTPGSNYTITVGNGGAAGTDGDQATIGGNSVFGTITAYGGGRGGNETVQAGGNGGSGGGSSGYATSPASGKGVYPGSSYISEARQGHDGGQGAFPDTGATYGNGGGGGGAGGAGNFGAEGQDQTYRSGNGGPGLSYSITGNLEYYAGGGGGGYWGGAAIGLNGEYAGLGGIGGGGRGGWGHSVMTAGQSGAPNTGGGGGGSKGSGASSRFGGAGGSGVVVLRYRVPQIATFLDSGSWTCPSGVTSVQALIVAGGGGGSGGGGGGGGAGGVVYDNSIPVTPGTTYPIVVGQGGVGGVGPTGGQGTNGANSSFANLIAIGGGYGATPYAGTTTGATGGSGGGGTGAAGGSTGSSAVGSGTYGQGNSGGVGYCLSGNYVIGGGGGGAGAVGATYSGTVAGNGGAGLAYSISGSNVTYGGGGGGGIYVTGTAGSGGAGGGGAGANGAGTSGTANTGGGGGGSNYASNAGAGGSGIVIIRWVGA